MGIRLGEVKVNHRPRRAGKSKYGLSRVFRVLLDLLTVKFLLSFSGRPIQFFGGIGLVSGSAGVTMLLWLSLEKILMGKDLADRPIVLLAILLILAGMQFITVGLLAEMQARIKRIANSTIGRSARSLPINIFSRLNHKSIVTPALPETRPIPPKN
jgi:hypothetical protein